VEDIILSMKDPAKVPAVHPINGSKYNPEKYGNVIVFTSTLATVKVSSVIPKEIMERLKKDIVSSVF